MFNNTTLDVAIGLIFIFLIYSLLATTIKEFIATIFSYRGRMLERGLEQMLDGKNVSYYWWDKLCNIFLWSIHRIPLISHKEDPTRYTFYDFVQNKKPDNDQITTVEKIKTNKIISNENIKYALADPANKENNPKPLIRVKLDQKAALFAANITDHPLYKRAAQNTKLSKKPAYISADTFSDILVDVLSQYKSTALTSPVLMKDISSYVNNQINNDNLKKILNIYIEQANGDLQRFKGLLENWYDDTMQRVSGWYKKQANYILMAIGLSLAFVFNINTVEIVDKLSSDKTVRDQFVKNATDYVNKKTVDSVKQSSDSGFATAKKHIDSLGRFYQENIEPNNVLLGLGWNEYGYKDVLSSFLKVRADDSVFIVKKVGSLTHWEPWTQQLRTVLYFENRDLKCDTIFFTSKNADSIKAVTSRYLSSKFEKLPKRPGILADVGYIIGHTNGKMLAGFLITAFAISLGAPFWFDLLNRFVNLRVSGAKPDDDKNKTDSKTPKLNKGPDPAAKA